MTAAPAPPAPRFPRAALLPLVLAGLAVLVLHVARPAGVLRLPWLQFTFQIGLVALAGCAMAFVAARSYVLAGQGATLFLGCGALAFVGSAVLPYLAGWADVNTRVTVHNLSFFLAAVLHFAGVAIETPAPAIARRGRRVVLGYGATLAVLALLWWAAAYDVTADFFDPSEGGTPLRQGILVTTLALFAASALLLSGRGARRSGWQAWYASALVLLALAVLALLLQPAVGSAIGWVGLVSQWVGAAYLLVAALRSVRETAAPAPLALAARPTDPWLRYGLALVFVIAATVLRLSFFANMGSHSPFALYYLAVLLAALYGGWGPGWLALATSLLAGGYFWVEPQYQIGMKTADGIFSAAAFALTGPALMFVVLSMQKARTRFLKADFDRRVAQAEQQRVQELSAREAHYRLLFDGIDQGVCVCEMITDAEGRAIDYRFLEFNAAFPEMTGLAAAAPGRTALELVPGLERHWIETYAKVGLGGETLKFEAGSSVMGREFEVFARPVEPHGRFCLFFTDVTRRKAEAARRQAVADHDRHVLALNEALRAATTPTQVRETAARRLAEALSATRVTCFEVQGTDCLVDGEFAPGAPPGPRRHPMADLGEDLLAAFGRGDVATCADAARDPSLGEAGRVTAGAAAYVGVPLLRDGALLAAVLVQADRPRVFSDDEIRLVEDTAERTWAVVERMRSDAARARSERVFRILGEAVPDLLWMARADGSPEYQNPAWCRYTGMPGTDLFAGEGRHQVPHPDDRAVIEALWRAALAEPAPFEIELRCRRQDGAYRWFLGRTVPVFDDAGVLQNWIGVMTDIHDRVSIERALQEDNRRKDEFLAMLAHELRNPLAPVRSLADVIRLAGAGQPVLAHAADVIERQVRHMTRLVDDLLDVSRITRGRIELRREPLDLAQVIDSALESSREAIDQRGQALVLDLPAAPICLQADETRLAQVFANLLQNASKYSEPGGRIAVSAAIDGPDVVVRVRDEGVGIPPAMLESIFDLFEQVNRSGEQARGGLGIGLTLVRQLVELHGGQVRATSDGPGRGSTFEVRLPLAEGAARPAGRRDGAKPAAPAAGSKAAARVAPQRILVVDDNVDAVEAMAILLSILGHEVRSAHDGEEALAIAAGFEPAVVLLDLGMPRMDGFAAAAAMRRTAWGRRALLVAVTGWGHESDLQRTRDAGFDLHLVKPVDVDQLVRLIDDAFGSEAGL